MVRSSFVAALVVLGAALSGAANPATALPNTSPGVIPTSWATVSASAGVAVCTTHLPGCATASGPTSAETTCRAATHGTTSRSRHVTPSDVTDPLTRA